MKERPILFSAPMVCAILEGRKTQTRRVIDGQPLWVHRGVTPIPPYGPFTLSNGALCAKMLSAGDGLNRDGTTTMGVLTDAGRMVRCPYGVPGDRLWVREVHWRWGKWVRNGLTKIGRARWKFVPVGTGIRYMENQPKQTAKRDGECGWVYRHSRFMFRTHSRITLEITDVRVQRLQEISEADAQAEGAQTPGHFMDNSRDAFDHLWDSINGKTHPWASNPWLWALTFKRVQP